MKHNVQLVYSSQDIRTMFNIHKATLLRWIQKGIFPPPDIKVTERSKFWKKSTIDKLYKQYYYYGTTTIKNSF